MKPRFCCLSVVFFALIAFTQPVLAQQPATQPPAREESSYIDEDSTAYSTRIVPVPQTISPEAQTLLARQATGAASHEAPPPEKPKPVQIKQMSSDATRAVFPGNIEFSTIAGWQRSADQVCGNRHAAGF